MIPTTLWNDQDSIMHLPSQLIACWETLLDKYALREKAVTSAPEGFTGGMSEEDTNNHLAWRFTGSCGRAMIPMLDPHEELAEVSDAFARIFSGNRVFLADLPCGSGAASLSILSTLCELRKQGLIPRMPLEIVIVGGEISKYAREYANEALASLIDELQTQAITIDFEIMDWDVCDSFSNTDLIKHMTIKSQNSAAKLLILANFSDFLERDRKWKEAETQFNELFRHSRDENSVAIWIEPNMNTVKSGFFPRLSKWFQKLFAPFFQIKDESKKTYAESMVKTKHPLNDGAFRNGLVVMRFDLPTKGQ